MNSAPEFITVFRSAEETAEDDSLDVRDQLVAAGIEAALFEDKEAEAWEVRVPAESAAQAGHVLAVHQPEAASEATDVDPSTDLDQVTIYTSETALGEMEAMSIRGLLTAAGIPAFIVGASSLPVLAFEVRVPRDRAAEAQEIVDQAQAVGAQSADEAQSSGESSN